MDVMNAEELDKCGRSNGSHKRKAILACCDNVFRPNKSGRTASVSSGATLSIGNLNCRSGRQIISGYQNFISSALPLQILWFVSDMWKEFPSSVVQMVQVDFMEKKGIKKVSYQAQSLLLDFVHMLCIFMETGHEAPIAWIDEHGKHYFPELSADEIAIHGHHDFGNYHGSHNMTDEVGSCSELSESVAESTNCGSLDEASSYAKVETTESMLVHHCSHEAGNDGLRTNNSVQPSVPSNVQRKLAKAHDVSSAVESMLLQGMHSLITSKDIVGIYRAPFIDSKGQCRFVPFQKNIGLITNRRGNANVRYAWLACSRDAVDSMMLFGLLKTKKPSRCPSYGIGTYLAPANCSNLCFSYCDTDEIGFFHLMLCRVIMGAVEVIQPGSQQHCPSDDRFDTGVDDLKNPQHYIIWDINVETHIYPEFVVTIKIPSETEGVELRDASGLSSFESSMQQIRGSQPFPTFPKDANSSTHVVTATVPSSPWMRFSDLFAALSAKVHPKTMEQVNKFYDDFKAKKISRIDLVKKMRTAVGDQLMVSTIMRLQKELPGTVKRDVPRPLSGAAALAQE